MLNELVILSWSVLFLHDQLVSFTLPSFRMEISSLTIRSSLNMLIVPPEIVLHAFQILLIVAVGVSIVNNVVNETLAVAIGAITSVLVYIKTKKLTLAIELLDPVNSDLSGGVTVRVRGNFVLTQLELECH